MNLSVVIPVYNGERFLAEALESVFAQTLPVAEVVVVDDGSMDGTAAVAERYPVALIRQENRGVAAARNAGIAATSGEWLAFLDADDRWAPDKLERQMAAIAATPETELCTAHFAYFLHPGVTPPPLLDVSTLGVPQPKTCPSTWLVRRTLFERAGHFPEDFRTAEDIAWLKTVNDAAAVVTALPEALVEKRIHDTNISGNSERAYRPMFAALRSSLLDQRKAAE